MAEYLLLAVAAFFAGMLNTVAGGGTFLTFPALVYSGVPLVAANTTSAVAVFPGYLGGAADFRRGDQGARPRAAVAGNGGHGRRRTCRIAAATRVFQRGFRGRGPVPSGAGHARLRVRRSSQEPDGEACHARGCHRTCRDDRRRCLRRLLQRRSRDHATRAVFAAGDERPQSNERAQERPVVHGVGDHGGDRRGSRHGESGPQAVMRMAAATIDELPRRTCRKAFPAWMVRAGGHCRRRRDERGVLLEAHGMNGAVGTFPDARSRGPGAGARPHLGGPARSGALAPLRSKSGLGDRRHRRRSLNLFLLGLLRLAAFAIASSCRQFGIRFFNVLHRSGRVRTRPSDAWMGGFELWREGAVMVLGDRLGPGAGSLPWATAGRKVRMMEFYARGASWRV